MKKMIKAWLIVKAWFCIGRISWLVMIFGYLWVIFSYLTSFELPSSGAILGCCALIAEMYFLMSPWRKMLLMLNDGRAYSGKFGDAKYLNYQNILNQTSSSSVDSRDVKDKIDLLFSIAVPSEKHYSNKTKMTRWLAEKTADRFDKYMTFAIVVTAVTGAIIWGYGHCFSGDSCDVCTFLGKTI